LIELEVVVLLEKTLEPTVQAEAVELVLVLVVVILVVQEVIIQEVVAEVLTNKLWCWWKRSGYIKYADCRLFNNNNRKSNSCNRSFRKNSFNI
jgi:hypothetical protein